MIEDMQVRNRSPHTQASYVQQVSLFARFFDKSPELLGPEDIRTYQVFLTNEKRLTPKSISVAVAALRFLYNVISTCYVPATAITSSIPRRWITCVNARCPPR